MKHTSELLMPAGSLEKLKIAILYGADAVYMGTPDLSLRTRAHLSLDDVVEGVRFAHAHGKRAYLTLNLFSHNRDIAKLPLYLETIRKVQPDGVIVADPGVFAYVKTNAPELELHISTQANVCSWLSVDFWKNQGAKLVVLAREVSFAELREIREKCPDIKLEAFIHGAMCMTYSGRCLLSNFMVERGANQGNCANACRWNYKLRVRLKDGSAKDIALTEENKDLFEFLLEEAQRPNEFLEIEEDSRGSYILNSKDLCLMPRLNDYLELGIDSLKIEGRNRSAYYVALTARAYRMAIDAWRANPETWTPEPYLRELDSIANKGYTMAFHEGRLTHHAHNYEETSTLSPWEFAGIVRDVTEDAFLIDIKNRIQYGDILEFVPPLSSPRRTKPLHSFEDINNRRTTTHEGIHAGQKPLLRLPFASFAPDESPESLRAAIPILTVIRKTRLLTDSQKARLALDDEALNCERHRAEESTYQEKRHALLTSLATASAEAPHQSETEKAESQKTKTEKQKEKPKAKEETEENQEPQPTAKTGSQGCCGRGCNGCLHFWTSPDYEKSRAFLQTKPPGTLLTPEEARALRPKKT